MICAFLCSLALSGCNSTKPSPDLDSFEEAYLRPYAKEIATYDHLDSLCNAAKLSSTIEIFEGLPHPMWEMASLASERKRDDVFINHKFAFYSPPLGVSKRESIRLHGEIADHRSYSRWNGPKRCGGFHPDLLIRFWTSQGRIDVHLCFGCGEAILYGLRREVYVNMTERASKRWEKFQKSHQTKRPIKAR